MIETLLISLTATQIIILLIVTVAGGIFVGASAVSGSEVFIGCGMIIVIQIMLFWTSAHVELVLYGYESGIMNINPNVYVLMHHGVQLVVLWLSFLAGRAMTGNPII